MRPLMAVVCVMVLTTGVVFSGCTQTKTGDQRFVGTWLGTYAWAGHFNHTVPANVTFFSNGTYYVSIPLVIDVGNWSVDNGTLTKTMHGQAPITYTFVFFQGDTRLLLTSTSLELQWNLTRLSTSL